MEAIRPRDLILTFDAGPQPVLAINHIGRKRPDLSALPHLWPLAVPVGVLGKRQPLQLQPEQLVLIEADAAEEIHGDRFVLVPAASLDGWTGIARRPPARMREVVTLTLETSQLVYCAGGALLHCLAASPAPQCLPEPPEENTPRLSFRAATERLRQMGQECSGAG